MLVASSWHYCDCCYFQPDLSLCLLCQQGCAADCNKLLRAIADAVSDWSAAVDQAAQQQQQQKQPPPPPPLNSTQQPAELHDTAYQLQESSIWLPIAANSLLSCILSNQLYSTINNRQLLITLRRLLERVRYPHLPCTEILNAGYALMGGHQQTLLLVTCLGAYKQSCTRLY